MGSMLEVERKFLLSDLPNLDYDEIYRIDQYYVTNNIRFRCEKRISKEGAETRYLCCTKKQLFDYNPCINKESTFQIPRDMYVNIFETGNFKSVSKRRHVFKYEGFSFEIDQFLYSDIIMLEVEYSIQKQEIKFPEEIQKYIIKEVTMDESYKNYNLAK